MAASSAHRYTASIRWQRGDQPFIDNRYSRRHEWRFDGGLSVPGSSSPLSVAVPLSDPSAVDPEEAFVASLSSCHLLWFLDLACRAGWVVDDYRDDATGTMGPNGEGKLAMTRVVLRPTVRFAGPRVPSAEEHARLHHAAHAECFIASSVKTEVLCEPTLVE